MRVRLRNNLGDVSVCWFQFTHPCGCDGRYRRPIPLLAGFNSRTRVGATQIPICFCCSKTFQFTHPCGCDKLTVNLVRKIKSFNSRTRVGATAYSTVSPAGNVVSIHAPVWVRRLCVIPLQPCHRFQFTHPCGCDMLRMLLILNPSGFNSRTRVGATP